MNEKEVFAELMEASRELERAKSSLDNALRAMGVIVSRKNERSVQNSNLLKRTKTALHYADLRTDEEIRKVLREHGPGFLLRIPNFGRKSLNDVMGWLSEQSEAET